MRIVYLGNFGPPHSSENDYAKSFEALGHEELVGDGEADALPLGPVPQGGVVDPDFAFGHGAGAVRWRGTR